VVVNNEVGIHAWSGCSWGLEQGRK